MTDIENRIANILIEQHDEIEKSYPYLDYRLYADGDLFNEVISSQGKMTDVLFFVLTKNREYNKEYVQLFISSPDDMCQEFVYITSLTEDEQNEILRRFLTQTNEWFGTEIAEV